MNFRNKYFKWLVIRSIYTFTFFFVIPFFVIRQLPIAKDIRLILSCSIIIIAMIFHRKLFNRNKFEELKRLSK